MKLFQACGRGPGQRRRALVVSLMLLAAAPGLAVPARAQPGSRRPVGFLTAPAPGDPLRLARRYMRENHGVLGLEAADLDDWILTDTASRASRWAWPSRSR